MHIHVTEVGIISRLLDGTVPSPVVASFSLNYQVILFLVPAECNRFTGQTPDETGGYEIRPSIPLLIVLR
jgi:hypothetical protein